MMLRYIDKQWVSISRPKDNSFCVKFLSGKPLSYDEAMGLFLKLKRV